MTGLICSKELMLTKLMVDVSVLFVITGTFLTKILGFIQKYVVVVII